MNYDNDKLNQIYRDTWPNLGWAAKENKMTENYPDEMFEEAAKREKDAAVVRDAIKFMDEYSDAMKQLADIERKELIEKLEAKKKENFQLVADACMKEYTKTYGEMPENDSWMFLEAEYYGTGEGQTICLQMTQANPRGGDNGDFDRSLPYPDNYKPINTKEYRAVRGFHKLFGTWHLHGLRFHTREAFFDRYANQLPATLVKLKDQQCFLEYHSELHYNFG
jgi:hypothetical protein